MEITLQNSLSLALDIDRFMRVIHASLHPKAEASDRQKVGPFGGMVLMTIAETEPISIQALTRQLARDKAQMTRIIQLLEQKELLVRKRSSEDGRVSLVSLTDEGQTLVDSFQDALADVVEELLKGVSTEERKRLSATLQKILLNAGPVADR
ncbi:MAG: MarR family transcriptional regulator [Pseudomonadota bacterium]